MRTHCISILQLILVRFIHQLQLRFVNLCEYKSVVLFLLLRQYYLGIDLP